ncbi:hypothetical protein KKB99_07340 [bacterium]|nr:hypothetical protein [bacterium]MBU1025806.1 hypothetical protein [bacterium]
MFTRSCMITLLLISALISECSVSSPTTPSQPEKGNTPDDAIEALNGLSQGFQQIILEGTIEIDPSDTDFKTDQDRDNQYNYNITSFLGGDYYSNDFLYRGRDL